MASSAIAKGSIVLVTGINGFIGSHIGDKLLADGFKVRGTVRDISKSDLIKDIYKKRHGLDNFEAVIVSDIGADGALTNAIKGCSGVVFVASDMSFSPDPSVVIPMTVKGVNALLKAAVLEPTVKRVVYTSSSMAASVLPEYQKTHVDTSSWNLAVVEAAWKPPPYEASRGIVVYAASKLEGEKACWDFVKSDQGDFVLNTVLPYTTWGEILDPRQSASSAGLVRALWDGQGPEATRLGTIPPRWFVNVKDVALLHVAALTEDDVRSERLFAYAGTFNDNDLLHLVRRLGPDRKFPDDLEDDSRDMSTVDTKRSVELLQRCGRPGFTSMEATVRQMVGLEAN